jgi:predicted ATPase
MEIETLLQTAAPIFVAQFAGVGYVYGEAGMGKSRLLYELRQQLGDKVSWLYCPADEVLRQSLNPFRYYLRNYFRLSSENTAGNWQQFKDIVGDILFRLQALSEKRAVFLAGEIERTSSFLAALLDIYWPDSLYEQLEPKLRFANTLTALSSFIQAQALFRPVIIQFEDFHWFDADSRHLLTTLCHDLNSYPAALFLTSRFLDDGEAPAVPLPSATPHSSLILDALDRTGVRALAEQLLGGPIDPDLLGFLVEKSDGRPFFAEQLTLELSEQAAIHHEANQFILLPEKVGTIPTTLNTLLISRLDRLTPSIKQVVQTAAILGERFLVPVLQEMLVQDNQLPEKLKSAAQRRIWVLHDELRYMFKHALLRDAAYEMQLQSRRRELHRLAAMNLEIIYAPHLGPYYGEIAHHYEKAWQQGLGTVRRQALHYLSLSAERAMNKFENEIALGYLGRALHLTAEDEPEERFGLLLMREKIYSLLANLDSWEADLRALFALVTNQSRSSKGKVTEKTTKKAMVIFRWAWFDWHNGD